jgi:hypothetical protein
MRAHPADVRAPPLAGVRAPKQMCVPLAGVRALPTWVRRRACLPPRRRACPTPAGVHAPRRSVRAPSQTCAPCPQSCAPCPHQCARLRQWWQNKIYKEGPSYPHFTTFGFVSWDSFVGSLQEVVGMVQHFRFLPF